MGELVAVRESQSANVFEFGEVISISEEFVVLWMRGAKGVSPKLLTLQPLYHYVKKGTSYLTYQAPKSKVEESRYTWEVALADLPELVIARQLRCATGTTGKLTPASCEVLGQLPGTLVHATK